MAFYLSIFFLSLVGLVVIIFRHREELIAKSEEAAARGETMNFAVFMERLCANIASLWHSYLRARSLVLLEKLIRRIRNLVLKVENLLFRTIHRLRGISNGEKSGQNKPE